MTSSILSNINDDKNNNLVAFKGHRLIFLDGYRAHDGLIFMANREIKI